MLELIYWEGPPCCRLGSECVLILISMVLNYIILVLDLLLNPKP